MGKKLDLTALTEDEAEHVLQVVQRDFDLRKKEQERLSELKQKLNEEGNKCTILSKQEKFNENCCIRCCSAFTFLINTKHPCSDCKFNICKNCGAYSKKEKAWICTVCHQARLLRTQSLEWYYNNVKGRFKHFGSAKVVHTLYKRRLAGRGSQSSTLGGNVLDGSQENEERICGSGCTPYRQTDGHALSETLAVALRVAEEAIEEAITKADSYSDSLEKQNESQYLQEHKEELIEELATTIMQKVIKRRKSGSGLTDSESDQALSQRRTSTKELAQPLLESRQEMSNLWRSHSDFSLTNEDTPPKERAEANLKPTEAMWRQGKIQPSQNTDIRPYSLPTWKSMEPLDNAGSSAVLHSPDGNWMAVQSRPSGPPRLLTKPKSQVFAALEQEADVVSAYDEMGTDEDNDDDIGWSSALGEFGPHSGKLSDETYFTGSQQDNDSLYAEGKHRSVTSPSSGRYTETMRSDSETSPTSSIRISVRGPDDQVMVGERGLQLRGHRASGPHYTGQLDINYNTQPRDLASLDSSDDEDLPDKSGRKHRRRKRSKGSSQEQLYETEGPLRSQQSTSKNTCQELSRCMFVMEQNLARLERRISLGTWSREESPVPVDKIQTPEGKSSVDADSGASLSRTQADVVEKKLKSKMVRLITKLSDKESSSGDELDLESTEGAQETSSCDEDRKHIQDELVRKYSAISLCSITTEALKVLGATEDLIEEATQEGHSLPDSCAGRIPSEKEAAKLQAHLSKLEENVYITAGTVYSLEGQLNDLEDCARSIHSITTETKLADLEDQVATAAAQVHQAELQVSDIERRISALNVAGLNVVPCERLLKKRNLPEAKERDLTTSGQSAELACFKIMHPHRAQRKMQSLLKILQFLLFSLTFGELATCNLVTLFRT
ncbi:rab effector MyRIP-like [Pristis pectinata]|uniref:rab effector MyRIP-like n=1 Tax=Pristis pectinata TaxID=685728 RepID=UPI00223CA15A|nr:rab effector MyRIP-like [Pristis pectinata]